LEPIREHTLSFSRKIYTYYNEGDDKHGNTNIRFRRNLVDCKDYQKVKRELITLSFSSREIYIRSNERGEEV
jgi:hypothetical protein